MGNAICPTGPSVVDDMGRMLQKAVKMGDLMEVERLITRGVNVDWIGDEEENPNLESPLIIGVDSNAFGVVKLLLEHNAKANRPNLAGVCPLHYAILNGRLDMVQLLVSNGADVNVQDGLTTSALQYAVRGGQYEIAEYLLQHHANVNFQREDGYSALHVLFTEMADDVDEETVKKIGVLLFQYGADDNLKAHVRYQRLSRKSIKFQLDPPPQGQEWMSPYELANYVSPGSLTQDRYDAIKTEGQKLGEKR